MEFERLKCKIIDAIDREKEENTKLISEMSEEERKEFLKENFGIVRNKWLSFDSVKKVIEKEYELKKNTALIMINSVREIKINKFAIRIKKRKSKYYGEVSGEYLEGYNDFEYGKSVEEVIIKLLNRNPYILKTIYNYMNSNNSEFITGIPPRVIQYLTFQELGKVLNELGWDFEVFNFNKEDVFVFEVRRWERI